MPDHRLTPKREGFSDKITALDHLAYRVWQQYKLSADDYGVMPDLAASIQAGNRRLAQESTKAITVALASFVECGLLHRFVHQGQAYLYSRVWQDHQKIRYPSETFHPVPPSEELAQCSAKTHALFAQRLQNGSPTELEDSDSSSPPPVRAHSRNANANALANRRTSGFGPLRRHSLEEMPDANLDADHCERAEDFLAVFGRLHLELRGARYTGKYERDQPEALRLVTSYADAELEAITRLYLVATGPRYDNEPRSPGRLRDAAGEMEKRLKEAGKWPTAA